MSQYTSNGDDFPFALILYMPLVLTPLSYSDLHDAATVDFPLEE
jgi:hypothetical protein